MSQLPVKGGSGVVSSAFVADLVELFLTSLNKYVATRVIQQLSDWAYHILHGTSSRRVFLPGESDSFIEKPRVQTSRGIMVQGFLSVFWGDYKVALAAASHVESGGSLLRGNAEGEKGPVFGGE